MAIRPQRKNANRHTQRGMGLLESSIEKDGWIGAITTAADGETFDGSARVEVTARMAMLDDPIVIDSDGTRPIVVRRVDIPNADDHRPERRYGEHLRVERVHGPDGGERLHDDRDHADLGRHAGQRLQPDVYAHVYERADIAVCVSGASEGTVTAHKSIVGYTTRVICHEWTQKY